MRVVKDDASTLGVVAGIRMRVVGMLLDMTLGVGQRLCLLDFPVARVMLAVARAVCRVGRKF